MRGYRASLPVLLTLAACGEAYDWEGFVYPNESVLEIALPTGRFTSFEGCQRAAVRIANSFTNRAREAGPLADSEETVRATWECGYKCEDFGGNGTVSISEVPLRVCKETRDG